MALTSQFANFGYGRGWWTRCRAQPRSPSGARAARWGWRLGFVWSLRRRVGGARVRACSGLAAAGWRGRRWCGAGQRRAWVCFAAPAGMNGLGSLRGSAWGERGWVRLCRCRNSFVRKWRGVAAGGGGWARVRSGDVRARGHRSGGADSQDRGPSMAPCQGGGVKGGVDGSVTILVPSWGRWTRCRDEPGARAQRGRTAKAWVAWVGAGFVWRSRPGGAGWPGLGLAILGAGWGLGSFVPDWEIVRADWMGAARWLGFGRACGGAVRNGWTAGREHGGQYPIWDHKPRKIPWRNGRVKGGVEGSVRILVLSWGWWTRCRGEPGARAERGRAGAGSGVGFVALLGRGERAGFVSRFLRGVSGAGFVCADVGIRSCGNDEAMVPSGRRRRLGSGSFGRHSGAWASVGRGGLQDHGPSMTP